MTPSPAPGQIAIPAFIPGAFWVITHGHGVIPDGRRYLVIENWEDDWWLAWENGVVPRHKGTLLREQNFRRIEWEELPREPEL